jgi:hypothetical protein
MGRKINYYKLYFVITLILGIFLLSGCGRKIKSDTIFTEDLYSSLTEIDYWLGDEKLVINNEEDMKSIYRELSSLTLKNVSKLAAKKDGGIMIDLVTEEETIPVVLMSGEISVNSKRYYSNKDIVDSIRETAIKYEDLYSNDIFTEDLYENLIEIDCWPDEEKIVIDGREDIEEIFRSLSTLTLEEASPDYKAIKQPLKVNFVTREETVSIGLLPIVVCTEDKIYYTDSSRDLDELVRMVADRYQ